jgi:phage shock protein C
MGEAIMFCTNCGLQLDDTDRFCRQCGNRVGGAPRRPLMLDKRNQKIAGVCAGFARHWNMDLTLMRVLWVIFAVCTGIGFLAYLAAWMILPSDEARYDEARVTS